MRFRVGDWLVLVSALALLVLLFLDWFSAGDAAGPGRAALETSGWSSLGWFAVALVVVTIALALATVALLVAGSDDAVNLRPAVVLVVLAPLTFLVLAVRVLLFQPDLDAGLANDAVCVALAGWLGLLAALVLAAGAWVSLHDERTDAPGREFTPPEPRPAPPAT